MYKCECGIMVSNKNKSRHEKTNRHLKGINNQSIEKNNEDNLNNDDNLNNEEEIINDIESEITIENLNNEPDYLENLNNDVYKDPIIEEQIKSDLKKSIQNNKTIKLFKKTNKDSDSVISNELFSSKPTLILGKEKRELMNKILQHKRLFPDELKNFKIKKKPTNEDLQNYLNEIDVILNTTTIDGFITDSILSSIKMIENVSSNTKNYNISGLTDILKANENFNKLSRQLYLKYGCFNNISPEIQMLFLVITSMWICRQKNMKRQEINEFLNQEIN